MPKPVSHGHAWTAKEARKNDSWLNFLFLWRKEDFVSHQDNMMWNSSNTGSPLESGEEETTSLPASPIILYHITFFFFFPSSCGIFTWATDRHLKFNRSKTTVLLILIFKDFNWRIIALQCWVGSCHTTIGISHKYRYIPSLLNLPPLLPYPTPVGCLPAPG